jgi:hypothetical protein
MQMLEAPVFSNSDTAQKQIQEQLLSSQGEW